MQLETPILFLIFNRPNTTAQVFEAIRMVKPTKLYIAADGPRKSVEADSDLCQRTRALVVDRIDWDCNVHVLFRETNLGCASAVNGAITWFFDHESEGIILEDDCLPNDEFFRFISWGLNEFKENYNVGMVTGSNLVGHKVRLDTMNGFSELINIWGWGTWKRTWELHNQKLDLLSYKKERSSVLDKMKFSWWQRLYWNELFKFTICRKSTWDFQLQFTFFKFGLSTVYPKSNLIENLGFGNSGTHTLISIPEYVSMNLPSNKSGIFELSPARDILISRERDNILAADIWYSTPLGALRLMLMNILRRYL